MMTKREFGQVIVKAVSLLVVALGVLFMTGCGSSTSAHQVPASAKPHYDAFFKLAAEAGRHNLPRPQVFIAPIDPSRFSSRVIGYCEGGNVVLGDSWWATATEVERRILVFHELGHCSLGRDHLDGSKVVHSSDVGGPVRTYASIMNTSFIGEYAYQLDQPGFDSELVTDGSNNPLPAGHRHSHDVGCGVDD